MTHALTALEITSAVGNCQGFCRGKQCFYRNHLGKNIAEVIISQQTIYSVYNFYFSTKLLFTNKRYHLQRSACGTRSQIIHIFSTVHSSSFNRARFTFTSYIIISAKFWNVTLLNNFYFITFLYHLFICWSQRKKRLVTLSKSHLYKFLF